MQIGSIQVISKLIYSWWYLCINWSKSSGIINFFQGFQQGTRHWQQSSQCGHLSNAGVAPWITYLGLCYVVNSPPHQVYPKASSNKKNDQLHQIKKWHKNNSKDKSLDEFSNQNNPPSENKSMRQKFITAEALPKVQEHFMNGLINMPDISDGAYH